MRKRLGIPVLVVALAVGAPAFGQETSIEIKKQLLPKIKKAQAEGRDLGEAKREFDEGDKLLREGLQEEALEHFKKAKAAMPPDA
jgi:hypothetical protein